MSHPGKPPFWIVVCSLFLIGFGSPLVLIGVEDLRMVEIFSLDEAAFAYAVKGLLHRGTFELQAFTYGSIYPYLCFGILSLKALFSSVSEQEIIVTLRAICLGSGLAAIFLTYRLARQVYGAPVGVLSSVLLIVSPLFLRWSVEAHPDLLQLVFILLALTAISRLALRFRYRYLIGASLSAGLAFGTKYAGIFLLPTLALAIVSGLAGSDSPALKPFLAPLRHARTWRAFLLSAAIFACAFLATNPYAALNRDRFIDSLTFMRRVVTEAEDGAGLAWVRLLLSPNTAGLAAGLAGLVYLVSALYFKRGRGDRLCLGFWVLSYLATLTLSVTFTASQYLLPILPAVLIFAGQAFFRLAHLKSPLPVPVWTVLFVGLVLLRMPGVAHTFKGRYRDLQSNATVAAGRWLEASYPSETTVLYDTYAYVPPKFRYVQTFFGQSYPMLYQFKPDLLILHAGVQKRYADLKDTSKFRLTESGPGKIGFLYIHPRQFRNIHYTYAYLKKGRIPEYRLIRDFETVQVYEYAGPDREERSGRLAGWQAAYLAYRQGGFDPISTAAAYVEFGNLHAGAENWTEAKLQYRKSVEVLPDYNLAHYGLGVALARQDSFAAAEQAVEKATALSQDPASVYEKLGWDYYRMGQFTRSRNASRKAHSLDPDRPFPLFNEALTYLVEGNAGKADTLYAEAVSRYGLPDETARLLAGLLEMPDLSQDSRRVIQNLMKAR